MELVLPDDDPAGGKVYAARYPDNVAVTTATGFGGLNSTHCTFSADMLAYQKLAYTQLANLMAAAGLPVILQFGEFLCWFFSNYNASSNPDGGMAFYDSETVGDATTSLGRAPHRFLGPNDPPGDDLPFAGISCDLGCTTTCKLSPRPSESPSPRRSSSSSSPFDVNHDEPVGANTLGGALNFYINWDAVNWNTPVAAPFGRLKVEALDFGSGSRDMNLAREAIEFYHTDGRDWPLSQVHYILAAFNGGCPWERELAIARSEALPRPRLLGIRSVLPLLLA